MITLKTGTPLTKEEREKIRNHSISVKPILETTKDNKTVYLGEIVRIENRLTREEYVGIGETSAMALRDAFNKVKFVTQEPIVNKRRNKFYIVEDTKNEEGTCNVVIAKNVMEARKLGSFIEATENAESWIDISCRAIKEGDSFFLDGEDREMQFFVKGHGFVYTDMKGTVDTYFSLLVAELKAQKRYQIDFIPETDLVEFNWKDFDGELSLTNKFTIEEAFSYVEKAYPNYTLHYSEDEFTEMSCKCKEASEKAEFLRLNTRIKHNYSSINVEKKVIFMCSENLETK